MKNLKAVESPPRQHKKNLYQTTIVAKCPPFRQCCSHERLIEAIGRRELTESLEILAWYGFQDDLVILAIGCLQRGEVRL